MYRCGRGRFAILQFQFFRQGIPVAQCEKARHVKLVSDPDGSEGLLHSRSVYDHNIH